MKHGRVAVLDLGSTKLKCAWFESDGRLHELASVPAPPLARKGNRVEGSADAYLDATRTLLERLSPGADPDTPLAVASQRSSFVLWDAAGNACSSLVHWSDRSADDWCQQHASLETVVRKRAGLPLSPHYAGPKLAALYETSDPQAGYFGNLDSWIATCFEGTETYVTDPTMASRTLLFDLESGAWSAEARQDFGLPAHLQLPEIRPSVYARDARFGNLRWQATLGDQSAAVLSFAEPHIRINLGTGGFVLVPVDRRPGNIGPFLLTPLTGSANGTLQLAVEGTIHAVAQELDRQASPPTRFPASDHAPDAFVYPDDDGWGAPRWRSSAKACVSEATASLSPEERRRVWAEGVCFRVREILDGIEADDTRKLPIVLSGGLANDTALAGALASCLANEVQISNEAESTLLGVAALSAGRAACVTHSQPVKPGTVAPWLRDKYERWLRWANLLSDGAIKNVER